jgi:PAS domain S-box-containing protein
VTFVNSRHATVFGLPEASLVGEGWWKVVHPDDLEPFRTSLAGALAARRPFRAEIRVHDRDGDERWLRCEGVPRIEGSAFLGYVGCNVDVTEAKRAEAQRLLLVRELDHRVKNSLATAQALVAQSLRTARDLDEARVVAGARLAALGKAHGILTAESWTGAEVRRIVEDAVEPHAVETGRFEVAGPPARLAPRAALALAMALHELCTNAAKYGALSTAEGRVSITWTRTDGAPVLVLRWIETGGPPVDPPTRKGFGSRLMERNLSAEMGGRVDLRFERGGVTCTIEARVDDMRADGAGEAAVPDPAPDSTGPVDAPVGRGAANVRA